MFDFIYTHDTYIYTYIYRALLKTRNTSAADLHEGRVHHT